MWSFPFPYGSTFCFSDPFASKIPLATWLPFGMSPASFGVLSHSGFWFFPEVLPFPTHSSSTHPSSVSSLVSFRSCGLRSLWCLHLFGCFVSALHLLYSVRGSLFLSWTFFLYATSSSVSGGFRVLFLRSVTRSDLRFPLATGSPIGPSPFCFSWPLRLLLRLFRQVFVDVPWFSSLFLYPGFTLFLHLFARIRSALFLFVGVVPSIFSAFFFLFHLPGLFIAFASPVLCHSSVFLCGVLCDFCP